MSSWVLAISLGTLAFLFLPFNFDRYLISLVDSSSLVAYPEGNQRFYQDLNSDGISEIFTFATFNDSASCLLANTSENIVIDQWNFKGRFSAFLLEPIFTDFNHNGKIEISAITLNSNKLYLNIVEPYGESPWLVKNRLIDTIWSEYADTYPFLKGGIPTDLNHDGIEEILFSFSSGGSTRQPRKTYAYDMVTNSIWSSPNIGSYLATLTSMDLDQDGRTEITGKCYARNNCYDKSIDCQDNSSWFIVLDEKLNFKVPPVKMGPLYSQTIPIRLPVKDSLIDFVYTIGNKDSFLIFDWYRILPDYTIVKEKFPYDASFSHPFTFIYPAYKRGGLFENRWDKALFINSSGKGLAVPGFPKRVSPMDILNPASGIKDFEYCFLVDGKPLKVSFYSLEGKQLGSIRDVNYVGLKSICWSGKINGRYQLYLAGDKQVQWYEVRPNPWKYFKFLIWIGLIGGFFGFIILIRYIQANEFSSREGIRREILELQLKAVKNQLDPHFTFNALNGLSYLAMSGDTVKVSNFINHFSRLLRTQLHTSDQTLVKLRNEIDFLDNYMQLQRIRFDDQIKLDLDIRPDVDTNLLVPKMILQTHVENAVKHGLQPKLDGIRVEIGIVKVSVFNQKESTVILIEDNGVGRGNGNQPKEESTGKGLQVLEQIFSSVKLLYKLRITQDFEDLKDSEGKAAGTRVKIVIN